MFENTNTSNTFRLLSILAIKRPHASEGEQQFIEQFLDPYGDALLTLSQANDDIAAYVLINPMADGTASTTLFSCHIDTVHYAATTTDYKNHVVYDANLGIAYKDKADATCLGADDGAGIWLMLEMYDAGVPGTYVFHRGEERGGIGSKAVAANYPDWLKSFKRAVAFDRRGTTSVITEQGWSGECCSDAFASALASALNKESGFRFVPDPSGIYTDTAEYADLIPECTNISCGYEHEHSSNETLDVAFLTDLLRVCLRVEWDALPTERDPSIPRPTRYDYGWNVDFKTARKGTFNDPFDEWDIHGMGWRELTKWCKNNPEDAADLIMSFADRLVDAQLTEDDEDKDDATAVAYPGCYF